MAHLRPTSVAAALARERPISCLPPNPLTITDHHWPSLTITNHHWPFNAVIVLTDEYQHSMFGFPSCSQIFPTHSWWPMYRPPIQIGRQDWELEKRTCHHQLCLGEVRERVKEVFLTEKREAAVRAFSVVDKLQDSKDSTQPGGRGGCCSMRTCLQF